MAKNNEELPIQIAFPLPQQQSHNGDNGNEIWFYDSMNTDSIFALNKSLAEKEKMLRTMEIQFDSQGILPIKLYIFSYGGEVLPTFSAIDRIEASKIPIHSIVEGCAASAATMLSVSAHKRYMRKNAVMLLHQISGGMSWGKYEEIKDETKNLEMLMSKLKHIYKRRTKLKDKFLDDLLKHDIFLEANECLKYGLVDEII